MGKHRRSAGRSSTPGSDANTDPGIAIEMPHRDGENSEQTSEESTPGWGDSPYALKYFRGRDGASLRKSRRLNAMRRRVEHVEDVPSENPSPFYSLFEGATKAVLGFPADDDFIGPFWNELGELDTTRGSGPRR